jgi:hypothetical protein
MLFDFTTFLEQLHYRFRRSTVAAAVAPATPTTSTTSTGITTAPTIQQGPVGQPPATTYSAGGPTPFTYYTTNANGQLTPVVATFIPTFPATVLPPPSTTGTVWAYSQYLSAVGTNTVPPKAASDVIKTLPISLAWLGLLVSGLWGYWMMLPLLLVR